MMSESIDETLDKDEAEEETEELTNQVQYHSISLFSSSFLLWLYAKSLLMISILRCPFIGP